MIMIVFQNIFYCICIVYIDYIRPTIYVSTCVPEYISLYIHRLYLII